MIFLKKITKNPRFYVLITVVINKALSTSESNTLCSLELDLEELPKKIQHNVQEMCLYTRAKQFYPSAITFRIRALLILPMKSSFTLQKKQKIIS